MKVLSIEQMTNLKELGVDTSKASLYYVYLPTARSIFNETDELESEPTLFACKPGLLEEYPTFALQDIIELLPKTIYNTLGKASLLIAPNCLNTEYQVMYVDDYGSYKVIHQGKYILDAAYNMLIWVIENNYLKTK